MTRFLHFLFDRPPGPERPGLIEVVDDEGKSVNAGEWEERDGKWALKVPAPGTIGRVLQELYASEINCCLSSDWDNGWKVTIGAGQTTLAEGHFDNLAEAAGWLDRQAKERFPDSEYAKRHSR